MKYDHKILLTQLDKQQLQSPDYMQVHFYWLSSNQALSQVKAEKEKNKIYKEIALLIALQKKEVSSYTTDIIFFVKL